MDSNTTKLIKRMLSDAQTSAKSAASLIDIGDVVTVDDIQALASAANQADQAAKELNLLIGVLTALRHTKVRT